MKVVAVDDVVENRELLMSLLVGMGCEVRTASGGEEAVLMVPEFKPDLVFLDIRMPGMDGHEVRRQLSTEARRPKIVAVSASVLARDEQVCLESGFDGFLAKPFKLESLWDCLIRTLPELVVAAVETGVGGSEADVGGETMARLEVPRELASRLLVAAKTQRVTDLRRGMKELAALGPAGAEAARLIEPHLGRYDMAGVTKLLERFGIKDTP